MDRIVIARKFGEPDHILVFDRLADRRPHADSKIFEIERLKQRQGLTFSRPKQGDGGDRPHLVVIVQPSEFNGIGRQCQGLFVQRSVNAARYE